MLPRNPAVILYDATGAPLSVTNLQEITTATQPCLIVGGVSDDSDFHHLATTEAGRLRVIMGEDASQPVYVTVTAGPRSYYQNYLTNADEPASILSAAVEPFAVGGTTLTITVNGVTPAQTCPFPTRAAQPGIHYSNVNPATNNGNLKKLKVSVDGGALKEVVINPNLTSGAAIAAELQAVIRLLVENGTNVTVEYNTAEYPFRYVFKSGTTGPTSIMHVEKGADDLAKVMFVGEFGGVERIGLAADNYWAFEVVSELDNHLTNTVNYVENETQVFIQTVLGGSGASLQVTAGGANTYLQFTTALVTGSAGSGATNINVNGSIAPVRFRIQPPINTVFYVTHLVCFVRDDGAALNKFGGLAALTNGVKFEIKSADLPQITLFAVKTNADLMTQADEGELVDNGFATDGQDLVKAVIDLSPGVRIPYGSTANIYVTIQDNLTALSSFYIRAKGWVE